MKKQAPFQLSTDEDANLGAWDSVYVEAKTKQKLSILLSKLLRSQGKYLKYF